MTIKLQCACGAKYSFDVEPENNRMPFPVACPTCQADGTQAANQTIAESVTPSAPKLRVSKAPISTPAAPPPVAASQTTESFCNRHTTTPALNHCAVCQKPICLECLSTFGYLCSVNCRYQAEQRGITVPVYKFQKTAVEGRQFRKAMTLTVAVIVVLLLIFGAWIWYAVAGSHPRLAYALKQSDPGKVQFFAPNKMLMVNAKRVALHDLKSKKDLWSTALTTPDETSSRYPDYYVDKSDIWICQSHRLLCVNADNGEITKTIPITGQLDSFTPAQACILIVSSTDETTRIATRVTLPGGDAQSRQITVPRSTQHILPDDLPANVAPTAGVLLQQMEADEKAHRTITAISSEFFSAGENLVELRTTLIEAKVTTVATMKPKGPSHINGNLSASSSAGDIMEELSNDLKRSRTGGVRTVDESHYEVRLRRWLGDPEPVLWKGDVSGVPHFYSLSTVDFIVAGKALIVFDKLNNKLFEAKLSNPISELFTSAEENSHLIPAIQTATTLYFFDQAMMTAFDLPSGNVRWRLTSIGISRAQFDLAGALFLDTSAASPEDIQFPDQLKLEKISPIIMKVDAASGKTLWQSINHGQECFLSGKYVYTTSADMGGIGMANILGQALLTPNRAPTYFNVCRLDPQTGKVLWNYQPPATPSGVSFQNNQILLDSSDEVDLLKYLSF